MLFCSGIQKKRSPIVDFFRTPRCTFFFELFLGRFGKDLGIERDYNRTKSNGGRNREETKVRLLQSKIVGLRKCGGEK